MTEAIGASVPTSTPASVPATASRQGSFPLIQPRNLASWVFVIAVFIGALQTYRYFRPGLDAIEIATMFGFLVFGVYALPWLVFLRWIDRWTRIPGKLALNAFLWGGFAATFLIAVTGNGALSDIYTKTISPAFADDWGAALSAPFSEEIGKGVGVLLLMAIAPRLIRTPFDGFMVGAFVGLGFQTFEDVLYVVNNALQGFGGDEVGTVVQISIVRGLTGIVSHTFYSAIVGTGLVFLIGTATTPARRGRGLALIAGSMLVHGVWDAMGPISNSIGVNALIVMAVLTVLGLVLTVVTFRIASSAERSWMRELMEPEVQQGTVTAGELAAISGSWRERRRYLNASPSREQRKTTRRVLNAAATLATALSASGGAETPEVAHARAEVGRRREPALAPPAA